MLSNPLITEFPTFFRWQRSTSESQRDQGKLDTERLRQNSQNDRASDRKSRKRVSKRHFRELPDHVRDHIQSTTTCTSGDSIQDRLEQDKQLQDC